MNYLIRSFGAKWLGIIFSILFILACDVGQVTPVTKVREVTQVVPVTRVIQVPVIVITRVVPVTRVVVVTRIVKSAPLVTEAPTVLPPPAPAATEAPVMPALTEPPQPTPTEQLTNNTVLVWYDFENNFLTTGKVIDRSGNGFDAQVSGTVDITDGVLGNQGILFTGNGFIQAQVNPAAGRDKVSFSLWFKTEHPENNYKLASGAWWNGGPGSGWILATHIPEFWSDDTKGIYLPGISNNDNQFPPGEWIHEVVTYDGTHIREYTNGNLINTWPTTGAAIGQGQPMTVGAWPPFSGYNFQGSMDEFQIFGYTLTTAEVRTHYDQGR